MNVDNDAAMQGKQLRQARKAKNMRLSKLERELHRKGKALANTAVLLPVSKSAETTGGTTDDKVD